MSQQKTKGFTIIEVVLVLAIAGLIFLVVFLALPALQRSQRDTQRRADIGRFTAAMTQFQANNNGAIPTEGAGATAGAACPTVAGAAGALTVRSFITRYVATDPWRSPSNNAQYACFIDNPTAGAGGTNAENIPATAVNQVYYKAASRCNGEEIQATTARFASVRIKLEGAGVYCADNS